MLAPSTSSANALPPLQQLSCTVLVASRRCQALPRSHRQPLRIYGAAADLTSRHQTCVHSRVDMFARGADILDMPAYCRSNRDPGTVVFREYGLNMSSSATVLQSVLQRTAPTISLSAPKYCMMHQSRTKKYRRLWGSTFTREDPVG